MICKSVCACVCADDAFRNIGVPPLPDKATLTAILQNHVIGGVAADSAAVIAGGNKCYTTLLKKCVRTMSFETAIARVAPMEAPSLPSHARTVSPCTCSSVPGRFTPSASPPPPFPLLPCLGPSLVFADSTHASRAARRSSSCHAWVRRVSVPTLPHAQGRVCDHQRQGHHHHT